MKPHYEVRLIGRKGVPLSLWQWCPDPRPEPLPGRMGLRFVFDVPELKVVAKGTVDHLEVRCDGQVVLQCEITPSKVRRDDTFRVTGLELKVEA